MTYDVLTIANKIIARGKEESDFGGDAISYSRLSKLLYYMQAFHLGKFGEPLFKEDMKKTAFGPMIPNIHDIFRKNKGYGIPYNDSEPRLLDEDEDFFNVVYNKYKIYSASGLLNIMEKEMPYKVIEVGYYIPTFDLKKYFTERAANIKLWKINNKN